MKFLKKFALLLLLFTALTALGQGPTNKIDLTSQVKNLLPPGNGGTGLDTTGLSGCPILTAGIWSVSTSCGSGDFSTIASGTNTTATMTVGAGASLGYADTGTVNANQILGNTVPTLASGNLNWSGSAWQFVDDGGMVYPGAGISVSTGSAWDTSLTAPSSALVGVSDTQTITNKTFADNTPNFNNSADHSLFLTLQAGVSTSQQTGFQIKNKAGSVIWKIFMDTDSYQSFNIVDVLSGVSRFRIQDPVASSATYINSYGAGAVEINADANSGVGGLRVWNGNSTPSIIAAFTGVTSINFPGLAATSGHNCLQVDNSGFITNTGSACGSGSGSGTVTSFSAPSASWPTWLVPTVTNSTTTPSLTVAASAIPNGALANSAVTIGSTPVALGTTATSVSGLTVDGVSATTLGYVDATSSIQTQLNGKATTGSCSAGQYEITDSASGPTCAQVQYSQLGGTTPTWNQNTTGTAANLSGTPALPNGTTATTQTAGDNSTKVATTAYVATAVAAGGSSVSAGQGVSDISGVLSTTSVTTSQIPFGNNSPITSLEEIQVIPTAFAFTIPTNGIISGSTTMRNATSQLYLQTLPTATWIMSIYKYPAATAGCLSSVGSSIGTVSLSTSGVQTWSVTSTSFAIGDCLVLVAPSAVDTSAAGLYGSIVVVD